MTYEKAVKMLKVEYETAQKLKYIQNPLAYALHQVWKAADRDKKPEVKTHDDK